MDKNMKAGRKKPIQTAKTQRTGTVVDSKRRGSAGSKVVEFPSGALVPDEILSSEAKDRISDVVKKAASGGRTTIVSRGYAIAIVGPIEDIPATARTEAARLPTTEIKSGQTSIKGIIARNDWAVLTIHGEARAALYRSRIRRQPAQTEDKLDRFIDLLETTNLIEQRNDQAREATARLERFAESVHRRIERSLDLLEKIDPGEARSLRAQYAALRNS